MAGVVSSIREVESRYVATYLVDGRVRLRILLPASLLSASTPAEVVPMTDASHMAPIQTTESSPV
jgi:hypothetical protein